MTSLADVRAKLEAAQKCHPNAVPTLIEEALAAINSISPVTTHNFASLWAQKAVRRHEIRDAKGFAALWFHAGVKSTKEKQ